MSRQYDMLGKTQKRGIYLLPNLFTTAALFSGFYSIVAAMKGYFDTAAIAIFVAMILDSLDGRVARMTNTQTAFGAQYDSLSDMVAFGVAPGLIIYSWSLLNMGKLGWLAAFLYTAACALRLARFNAQSQNEDKHYFQGLPSPAAAAVITSLVWLGNSYEMEGLLIDILALFVTISVAALMVSTIRYYSFKRLDLKGRVPFVVLLVPIVILVAIAFDPPQMLFIVFFLYAFSAPAITLWQVRRIRRRHNK